MLSTSIPIEYTLEGLDFMILKENVSCKIPLKQLKIAEKCGKQETELRWSLNTQTNHPYITGIDEQQTYFYKDTISLAEKYAFRKGILMKMLELSTPLDTLSELIKNNQTTAIFLDYSFYGGAIVLFEADISYILDISREHLQNLYEEKHLIDASIFPILLNEYTPIPYHRYQDLTQYRHVYLLYSDIDKNNNS